MASAATSLRKTETARHAGLVRVTHWITVVSFFALLLSGLEIVISHPRFYWGETGNALSKAWLTLPIPASRSTVPTGFKYVLPDQNGWSRYLHFEAAWVVVLTGLLYAAWGLGTGHFRRQLLPASGDWSWSAFRNAASGHLRLARQTSESYNVLQRVAYLGVVFVLFPMVIWTGLAMSPSFDSAFPAAVTSLGGRQSARTIHFLISIALVMFVVVHVAMVALTGFRSRMWAMITGRAGDERQGSL